MAAAEPERPASRIEVEVVRARALQRAICTAPSASCYDYALVLAQRHKHARSETLLKADPANRAFRTVYANAHVGLGSHEALRVFRELAAEAPDSPDLHLSIAHALKTLGRQPPIFREGLDQWRHYGPWLGPLKTALGPYADPAHLAAARTAPVG